MRMLGLVFGHTVLAITTVLTAFMAGLGLGSYLFGKFADRTPNCLFLYGLLEAGIGVYCLAIPSLFSLVEPLYVGLYQQFHPTYYFFNLGQFGLILLLLLPPTTLMGATLPVLSRFIVENDATLGRRVGFLYALNTFGAVLGAAASGYLLLPIFGMRGLVYLSALVNIGIAIFAVYWSRLVDLPSADEDRVHDEAPVAAAASGDDVLANLTVFGLAVSGAASMIYEVAWSRALALIIGSSTYAFTVMLVAFLVGLAAGSAAFSRFWPDRPVHPLIFGALQTAIGLAALAMLPVFGAMPDLLVQVFRVSNAPGFIQASQFLLSFGAMLLPTFLIGATFPCVVKIASRKLHRVGTDVGKIYAVNTVGAVIGTFAAGFFLIPTIGAQATLKLAIVLNLATGAVLILRSVQAFPVRTWLPWTIVTAAGFGAVYVVPPWDPMIMSSGVAIYGPRLSSTAASVGLNQAAADSELVFYEDGISATVTVHRDHSNTYLRVNGKTDASTTGDMRTQLMLGHLPLLFHPNPKSVAIIGLGSGVTAAAVARYGVERIDVIEIEPAVVRASRFFEKVNRNVLKDPRLSVIIADGRNLLLGSSEGYDAIISEPSNPWISGVASLFTQEFFALAKRRLKPRGLMVQWVHGYGLAPGDLKMVVKTFRTAFPATTVWNTTGGDYLLLGRESFVPVDLQALERKFASVPGLRDDLDQIGFRSASSILADLILNEDDAERYSSGTSINTDDRLPLEFSAPLTLYLDTAQLNYRIMKGYQTTEFPLFVPDETLHVDRPQVRLDLGMAYLAKGDRPEAVRQFEKALAADSNFVPALLELGKTQLLVNLPLKAVANFETILRRDPGHAEATYQLGLAYQSQRIPEKAQEYLAKAIALRPENPDFRARLGMVLREMGRLDEAILQYLAAKKLAPNNPAILEGLGIAYSEQGQRELAVDAFKKAIAADSQNASRYHYQLGRAYLLANRFGEAVNTLLLARRASPLSVEVLIELAAAYLGEGKQKKAEETITQALNLDPNHPAIERLRVIRANTTPAKQVR